MTALAVVLGTSFMSASFVFTATLNRSLDSLFSQASAGTDVVVRHVVPGGTAVGAGSGAGQISSLAQNVSRPANRATSGATPTAASCRP